MDPTHPPHRPDPTRLAAPAPLDPVAEIATALETTENLDRVPTAHHVAAYERVHASLTDALSAIDEV